MSTRCQCGESCKGQSTVETVLMLPLYLLMVFGLLQMAELGLALVAATYGAHSITHKIVQANPSSETDAMNMAKGPFLQQAERWAIGRRSDAPADAKVEIKPPGGVMRDVEVHFTYKVSAFPLVSQTLNAIFGESEVIDEHSKRGKAIGGMGLSDERWKTAPFTFGCNNPTAGTGCFFTVRGIATARLNVGG